MFARALFLTALTIFLASPTSAQSHRRSEFAFVMGAYLPTNQSDLKRPWVGLDYCEEYPQDPACEGFVPAPGPSENQGVAVGGRWTGWLSKGAGIEASLWYAAGGRTGTTFLTSLRGVLSLDPSAHTSVVLLAGPAMVNRFNYSIDPASFGGIVGIAVDARLGHAFALRAQLEDYMYSVRSLFQHDFVVSLSLGGAL